MTATPSWRSIGALVVAAGLTVVVADRVLDRLAPADALLLQADVGIAQLAASDPTTIVLGSSHTRSFRPLAARIDSMTGKHGTLALVPEEGGLFLTYDWLFTERLRPMIARRTADGGRAFPRLRRVLVITTFYDMCPLGDGWQGRLASHGWRFRDFVADVLANGMTPTNRNFVRAKWNQLFPTSALVQDRGVGRIQGKVRWKLFSTPERHTRFVATMRDRMEEQFDVCWDPRELAAFEHLIQSIKATDLEPVIVLFPLDPDIISPKSRETTLRRYADFVQQHVATDGIRMIDITSSTPMVHPDFQDDLDHLTLAANEKFADWALTHDFRFLLDSTNAATGSSQP